MKEFLILLLSCIYINADTVTIDKIPSKSSIVVYSSGTALIDEEYDLYLKRSDQNLVIKNIASSIEPSSVHLTLPKGGYVLSQRYLYDEPTQQTFLKNSIGKKIKISLNKKTHDAKLLSCNNGVCMIKMKNNELRAIKSNDIILSETPKNLSLTPSLVFDIKNKKNSNSSIKLNYLVKDIRWRSDYTLNLGKKDTADLMGMISVQNDSSKNFKDTKLSVIAGEINSVKTNGYIPLARSTVAYEQDTSVKKEAIEGYYLFTLPGMVELPSQNITQFSYIEKKALKFKRALKVMVSNPLYLRGDSKHNVKQYINIEPIDTQLPKGVVRIYTKKNLMNILLGETEINNTPKNSPLELMLGDDHDASVVQSVLKRYDTKEYYEADILYELKNSSLKDKNIKLFIPFKNHEQNSIKSDEKFKFDKAGYVSFDTFVKADSIKKFKVRYRAKKGI